MSAKRQSRSETISIELLKEYLDYNPTAGVFTWLKYSGTGCAGKIAGARQPYGTAISIAGKSYRGNKLAWLYMTGSYPLEPVLAKDGDVYNLKFDNLYLKENHKLDESNLVALIHESFKYNALLGVAVYRKSYNHYKVNTIPGGFHRNKIVLNFHRAVLSMAQIVWALHHDEIPAHQIHCKDKCLINTFIENLEVFVPYKGIPSQSELKKLVTYDSITGEIRWLPRSLEYFGGDERVNNSWNAKFANKIAGHQDRDGYKYLKHNLKRITQHQIAWMYTYGEMNDQLVIDHIDGNKSNNSIANLRLVTRQVNGKNRRSLNSNNQTLVNGVYKAKGKYIASISINRQDVVLGDFATLEEAMDARRNAERTHYQFQYT